MEKERLFEIAKSGGKSFATLAEYADELRDVFSDVRQIPIVVGYPDNAESWRIETLSSQSRTDELTIQNYIEGVEAVRRYFDKYPGSLNPREFRPPSLMVGVSPKQRKDIGDNLFLARLRFGCISYSLGIDLASKDGSACYVSFGARDLPGYDHILKPFIGPKRRNQ